MKQIRVKIKASIAETSGGFLDLSASQPIFPPKREDGTPDVNHVFCVMESEFVRSKLRSGELILVDDEADENESGNSGSDCNNGSEDSKIPEAPGGEPATAENDDDENISSDTDSETTSNHQAPASESDVDILNSENASLTECGSENSDDVDNASLAESISENSDAE